MTLPDFLEVETSKFCNRRCSWCPNGLMAFRTEQELMPWDLFERLIIELAEHRFGGWLALHNYNEPLANPRLIKELCFVTAQLPFSKPSIFTNGDLLTPDFVRRLRDVGVVYLRVTRYPSPGRAMSEPSVDQLTQWLGQKQLLDLCEWNLHPARQGFVASGTTQAMGIEVIAPMISRYNWRGGTTSIPLGQRRVRPCSLTTRSAAIDFAGRLKMCCNVFADAPEHAAYVIGSLTSHSFAALWESKFMHTLRTAHRKADWSLSPICTHCSHFLPDEDPTDFRGQRL